MGKILVNAIAVPDPVLHHGWQDSSATLCLFRYYNYTCGIRQFNLGDGEKGSFT